MRRAPGWRDRAATDLVLDHLDWLEVEGPALVMEDPHGDELARTLERAIEHYANAPATRDEPEPESDAEPNSEPDAGAGRADVTAWYRRVRGTHPASPWPPPSADPGRLFRSAFLRLPKSKDELVMSVHAAAHRLAPGGRLFVYGAKDEGAGSVTNRLAGLFDDPVSVATGGRCRLIEATRPEEIDDLRTGLDAWRIETEAPHPDLGSWITYPGVFAAGRLDDGTALLLEHLPELAPDAGVLDFGCGDGVIAGVLVARTPGLRPVMLDADTVALEAAATNVPAGRTVPADGMGAVGTSPPFDAVVSNPPYHRGKAETVEVVREMVLGAGHRLAPDGSLTMVVQRRLPVDTALSRAFGTVEAIADRGAFRVWRGTAPSAAV